MTGDIYCTFRPQRHAASESHYRSGVSQPSWSARDECVSIFLLGFFLMFSFAFLLQPPGACSSPHGIKAHFFLSLSLWLTETSGYFQPSFAATSATPPNLHPVTLDILYPLLTVHMVQSGHDLGCCNPDMLHWSSPKEGSTGSLIPTTGQLMLLVAQTHVCMIDSH